MHPELKAQAIVAEQNKNDRSFIDPVNFYESERNSGYKNTGNALYEIIDNAYEANASKIFITAKNTSGTNKPESIAVIDNGTGMPKNFLHTACKIGGTHRPSSNTPLKRKGYGRFGHGLPKSSISQTRSFSVYTKNEEDKNWRVITVDIDELIANRTHDLPFEEEAVKLPDYIQECLDKNFSDDKTGTIVAWNKCDRMTWKTDEALANNLGWRVSMSYWRNIKAGLTINVLGNVLKPIDPLFIDESCEHVDSCGSNTLKAISYPVWKWPFKVKSEGKEETIEAEIRMSRFPPKFGSKDMNEKPEGRNRSIRQKILAEHNGLLFYRQGRFIDCMRHIPSEARKSRGFQTYDSNYKIEINFPSSLDESFGIATNKQYVNLPFSTLQSEGWVRLMTECANLYKEVEKAFINAKLNVLQNANAAIKAIDESDKIFDRPGGDPVSEQRKQRIAELASKNLEKVIDLEVERRKKALNTDDIDREKVRAEITPQYSSAKRSFEYEEKDEHSPFFRVEPIAGVRKYYLNKNHNFFKKIWMNPLCTDFMRETLKLMISAIGETQLGAADDARKWYFEEIYQWSRHLHITTDAFVEKNDLNDEEEEIIDNESFDDPLPN
tara:strand:+ start:519 stop:2345 length:1827 start_codon:yes stop_codon:yes gene_type:complete